MVQRKNKFKNKDLKKKKVSRIQNISEFQQGQFIHNYRKEREESVQMEVYC